MSALSWSSVETNVGSAWVTIPAKEPVMVIVCVGMPAL